MIKKSWKYYLTALVILLLDQVTKLWVHFNMTMGYPGAIRLLGDWFKIYYTLNPGMAFGIQFGFKYGKLLLTLGRIVASCVMIRYIDQLARKKHVPVLLIWGWALILGGAIGNVMDSTLYGKFLDNAPHNAPMSWFYGQVIDMIYVDLWEVTFPVWLPLVGGHYLTLFPIFNLADVAIFMGVVAILWSRGSFLKQQKDDIRTAAVSSVKQYSAATQQKNRYLFPPSQQEILNTEH
mmetsp:Transcript_29381/g.68003  ORF Transcript_29381/g.68003 Transcript_29381/m.68003 type:complete len:235 (+) Transcript_29381:912-1616(+)